MYIRENYETLFPLVGYYDASTGQMLDDYNTAFTLNGVEYNLKDSIPFEKWDVDVDSLILGSGLYLEATYLKYIKSYYLEEEREEVIAAWNNYLLFKKDYEDFVNSIFIDDISNTAEIEAIEASKKENMKNAYATLLANLENAIKEYNIEHGLEV